MSNLIIPEVYAGIVREKFLGRVKVANLVADLGFLKNTTVGDTVTFPKFRTITNPNEVVKGTPIEVEELTQTSSQATIKQVGKGVRVYDIDDLTAFGNFVQESATQQAIVFARKLDLDLIEEAKTSPLKHSVEVKDKLTSTDLNGALNLYGDEQDTEDFSGIVINSVLLPSLYAMPEFIDKTKTIVSENNGIITNGLVGFYRNIPVFLSDHGTYDDTNQEPITLIIKKNSLGYMTKRDINIELERMAKLKATDVVGDFIYAVKLTDDAGVVVLKKTIA